MSISFLWDDFYFVLAAVKQSGSLLQYASEGLKNNKTIALAAIKQGNCDYVMQYISTELKNDRDVVLAAVKKNASTLVHASTKLKDDKEIVLTAVKTNGMLLQYASNDFYNSNALNNDKDIVLAAVKKHGLALQYASDTLKKDRDVVLAALSTDSGAIRYVDSKFSKDKQFAFLAIKSANPYSNYLINHTAFNEFFLEFRNDWDYKIEIAKRGKYLNEYDIKQIKHNKALALEVISEALKHGPYDFNICLHMFPDFSNNKDIALKAVGYNGLSLRHVTDELKNDKDVVVAAIKQNYKALEFASDSFKADKEIVLLACKCCGSDAALEYTAYALKKEKEFILEVIKTVQDNKKGVCTLNFIPDVIKKDKAILLAALSLSPIALANIPDVLKDDEDIVSIFKQNPNYYHHASAKLRQSKEFIIAAVNSGLFNHIPITFKNDKGIVLSAIKQNGLMLRYIPDAFKKDKLLCETAVRNHPGAIRDISENLQQDSDFIEAIQIYYKKLYFQSMAGPQGAYSEHLSQIGHTHRFSDIMIHGFKKTITLPKYMSRTAKVPHPLVKREITTLQQNERISLTKQISDGQNKIKDIETILKQKDEIIQQQAYEIEQLKKRIEILESANNKDAIVTQMLTATKNSQENNPKAKQPVIIQQHLFSQTKPGLMRKNHEFFEDIKKPSNANDSTLNIKNDEKKSQNKEPLSNVKRLRVQWESR